MDLSPPKRIKHTFVQTIDAPPAQVFPLLCPVRELDWAPGWNPKMVRSASGVAELDCVFITPGEKPRENEDKIWTITRHDPVALLVEMILVTPGSTVGKLEIVLSEAEGNRTSAQISYTHTSLGPDGDAFLEGFTTEWYRRFMRGWEQAMNHFLRTGEKLKS